MAKTKKFDFNFYLSKSCPLPKNWLEKKEEILTKKFASREEKTPIYEWLHDQTIKDKNVT
jgi:hypothetical protein